MPNSILEDYIQSRQRIYDKYLKIAFMNKNETKVAVVKKYCKKCGSKLVNVDCNYYDEYTGERVKQNICSHKKCEARCDFYGHNYERYSLWHSGVKCLNCGYIPSDY